jgi:hypothetical protein
VTDEVAQIDASGASIKTVFSVIEIRKDSKDVHLMNIRAKTNVPFEQCVFFDDQAGK